MNDVIKKEQNLEIKNVLNQPYKYGFKTEIETEKFPTGINQDIIKLISSKKNEPSFLLNFRLKAYQKWLKLQDKKYPVKERIELRKKINNSLGIYN